LAKGSDFVGLQRGIDVDIEALLECRVERKVGCLVVRLEGEAPCFAMDIALHIQIIDLGHPEQKVAAPAPV